MLNVFSSQNAALKFSLPRHFQKTLTLACVLVIALNACESDEKRKSYKDFGPEAWDESESTADGKISEGSSGKTFEVGYLRNNGGSAPRQGKLETELSNSSWVVREHPAPNPVRPASVDGSESAQESEESPTKFEYYYQNGGAISAQLLNLDEAYCVLNQIPAGFVGQSPNDAVEALFLPKQIVVGKDELTLELHTSEYKFFLDCHHLEKFSPDAESPAANSENSFDFASITAIFGDAVLISKSSD